MIDVKDLTFAYEEGRQILENMSFHIEEGTIVAILGLSGCGKSTLCQILAGIIPRCISGNLKGSIRLRSEDIMSLEMKDLAPKIGYVMQDPDRQLITTAVEDELAFALENLAKPSEEIRETVHRIMKLLHIENLAYENPAQLSGGQKQVVAIGSILTMDPEVLILDEPMSHLDEMGKKLVGKTMRKLRQRGKTIIVVEHDYMTMDFADSWLVIEAGKVKAFGSPEEVLKQKVYP
ncbi:MAG: ABC transporter ATP-binding protein [Anaerovoracaceae bacterium]